MDLWIRSQNKKKLVKVNNVYIVDYNGYYYVASEIDGEEITLGKYDFHNPTRTLEVLDEIDKLMSDAVNNGLKVARYEMPKE